MPEQPLIQIRILPRGWRSLRRQGMGVMAQAALHQNDVVQGRDDRKQEGGAQEDGARNPNPTNRPDLKKQNKKHGTDLREGVGLAENAGAEVAQARNGEKHRAGGKDRNIAAEDHNRKLPRNPVKN